MAAIRRGLLIIVAIALVLDVGALAYIKISSLDFFSDEKVKLVLWIDDANQAKAARAEIESQNIELALAGAKRTVEKDFGFRVVMVASSNVLKSIEGMLRQAGYGPLSYSKDGSELYYGGFYSQKSEAVRTQQMLFDKEQVNFAVEPGKKLEAKPSNKIFIAKIGATKAKNLVKSLEAKGITVSDQATTPLAKE